MNDQTPIPRLETGVDLLDAIIGGGVPKGNAVVIAGAPGSGKTILSQQICFHNATPERPAVVFHTLSEPTAKTLLYLRQFDYFDPAKIDRAVHFVDLGGILRNKGLEQACETIMEHVKRIRASVVVIDSFKVFDDLSRSSEERRKFAYELVVNLLAWECTTFLLGEYREVEFDNPLFSIIDGVLLMRQRTFAGKQQRYLQVVKLRGTDHDRDEHAFGISRTGIELYLPRPLRLEPSEALGQRRVKTGISKLDDLLGEGIPGGSSLLVSGAAGTGKTVMMLEFVLAGAERFGEKGLYWSCEETTDRLRRIAKGMGHDLDRQIDRGLLDMVYVPQHEIQVESMLESMRRRIERTRPARIAVDSASVFLYRIADPQIIRDKMFELAAMVGQSGAVGLFGTDVPYGSQKISRFGVEETVADGVLLLSAEFDRHERQRYLEVYKLRNTAHLRGRHGMVIGSGGMEIYPRYIAEGPTAPPDARIEARLMASGIPGLDPLLGGGLFERSVTLVSGSPGAGKTTMGLQFIQEGIRTGEPGLFVTLEESPAQVRRTAQILGLPLASSENHEAFELLALTHDEARAAHLLWTVGDKVGRRKVKRLVLDCVSHFGRQGLTPDQIRDLLSNLVVRMKSLGVTSLFTLNSRQMFSLESVTESELSPVADNLLLLRYGRSDAGLQPTLTAVKTRGSAHDRQTHVFTITKGGIRVGEKALQLAGTVAEESKRSTSRGSPGGKPKGKKPRR